MKRIGEVIVDYRTAIADIDERLKNNLPPSAKVHYVDMGVNEVFKQAYDEIKDYYYNQQSFSMASVESAISSLADGDIFRLTASISGVYEILKITGAYYFKACPLNDLPSKTCGAYTGYGWVGKDTDPSDYVWCKNVVSIFPAQTAYVHYIASPTLATTIDSTIDIPNEYLPQVIEYALAFIKSGEKEFQIARVSTKEGRNTSGDTE